MSDTMDIEDIPSPNSGLQPLYQFMKAGTPVNIHYESTRKGKGTAFSFTYVETQVLETGAHKIIGHEAGNPNKIDILTSKITGYDAFS